MKLVRFGEKGSEKPGLVDKAGGIRSLADHIADVTSEVLAPPTLSELRAIDPRFRH